MPSRLCCLLPAHTNIRKRPLGATIHTLLKHLTVEVLYGNRVSTCVAKGGMAGQACQAAQVEIAFPTPGLPPNTALLCRSIVPVSPPPYLSLPVLRALPSCSLGGSSLGLVSASHPIQ